MYVARYSAAGSLLWANCGRPEIGGVYGNGFESEGTAVAAHQDGSVTVAGYMEGRYLVGMGASTIAVSDDWSAGLFVARFDSIGRPSHVERVVVTYNYAAAVGLCPLSDGSCVVSGGVSGTASFGDGSTILTTPGSNYDAFLAWFGADGTFDSALQYGGTSYAFGWSVAALADDSLVVGGSFNSDLTLGAGGPTSSTLFTIASSDKNGYVAHLRPRGGF
jgi:hypothetical protein